MKGNEGGDSVLCCGLGLQALAQELSGFVNSIKVRMAEEGTMTALSSVMRLCFQAASRRRLVRLYTPLIHPHDAEVTDLLETRTNSP